MRTPIDNIKQTLMRDPKTWLITGVAGFIGSNILMELLRLNQRVVGIDNFSTGSQGNLDEIRSTVSQKQWERFDFIEGDIASFDVCRIGCQRVDYILHHAAMTSVPLSILDPLRANLINVNGFLNILVAAGEKKVSRVVYASSSAVYGDDPKLPKAETDNLVPMSPYAATKRINEIYSDICIRAYGTKSIGLRYFNVFGPRQDPKGAYAAVVPLWFANLMIGERCVINGDGETSRDFCYIDDVVNANLLAAFANDDPAGSVFNIGTGKSTTLNQLFGSIKTAVSGLGFDVTDTAPCYTEFRKGDIRHSVADVRSAQKVLGYRASLTLDEGLKAYGEWHREKWRDIEQRRQR